MLSNNLFLKYFMCSSKHLNVLVTVKWTYTCVKDNVHTCIVFFS